MFDPSPTPSQSLPLWQLQAVLQKGLPALKADYALLQVSLQTEDWQTSAALSHKLKGVCHLFGLTAVLECLYQIEALQLEVIAHPSFRKKLQRLQDASLKELEHIMKKS